MTLAANIVVTLDEVKEQVNQTLDIDDALLERKIVAAQSHLEAMLGYPLTNQSPAVLKEAVMQLAAWWYAMREAAFVGNHVQNVPMGFEDIVANHRNYSWGADE